MAIVSGSVATLRCIACARGALRALHRVQRTLQRLLRVPSEAEMRTKGILVLCALGLLIAHSSVAVDGLLVPAGAIFFDSVNRWTLADSPVLLDGLLTIDRNATLTIDPGVVVNCTTPASGILVNNVLRILGTANQTVSSGCGVEQLAVFDTVLDFSS
jgi:hypothetical protein